jgi:methionine biosynthesis protein MetW
MQRHQIKRRTDVQIITEWIGEGQRILDIGCGRGILLEHLIRTRKVHALGVDTSIDKVQSCIKRNVPVYHGDADAFLEEFPNQFFDWVILSRMIQELSQPGELIQQSLKVGKNVVVGFVNQGFWLNRWSTLCTGSRPTNEVFPLNWDSGKPYNPVTIHGFQAFAAKNGIQIQNAVFLKGNWRTPTNFLPNLLAGYAIFHLRAD